MDITLGMKIKKLRMEKGVTQLELAKFMGVTYQSVSKWENNNATPDVSMLPKLATFFGIKIDDLFSINIDDEMERIDYTLKFEKLTDDNYNYAKRVLEAVLSKNDKDVGAITRYARLILMKNNRDSLYAGGMLERAMQEAPLNEEIYALYANVRGCSIPVFLSGCDWFIRVCEPYARQYSSNTFLLKKLIEIAIEREYFDKAIELIELIPCESSMGYPKFPIISYNYILVDDFSA